MCIDWFLGRPLQVTVRPMLSDRCLSCLSLSLVYCDQTVAWMMNQDATWYGGRPRHRRVCIRWGLNLPSRKRHSTPPPTFAVCGRKQICVRTLRPMSIVAKRLITGSSSMAGTRSPPRGLGKDAVDCVESVDSQSWRIAAEWIVSEFEGIADPVLSSAHVFVATVAHLLLSSCLKIVAIRREPDMECTPGTTTCKQKTLDVGKSVSLAQADGQHSPGCSAFVNRALFW